MRGLQETRYSLMVRLISADSNTAWEEFFEIYEPAIYRFARGKGLQHADAEDVTQDVVAALHRRIDSWDPDSSKGSLRAWLFRVTINLSAKALLSRRNTRSGGSEVPAMLEQIPEASSEDKTLFQLEYRRRLFEHAAILVKNDVQPKSWQAFWQTTVDGLSAKSVAKRLGMRIGAVYTAKCRVMSRLRDVVKSLECTNGE